MPVSAMASTSGDLTNLCTRMINQVFPLWAELLCAFFFSLQALPDRTLLSCILLP